ncbi:MAG: peptidylprolyl isomerase [Saprospiraceae bacterium]|nr:peptidylprolyl isomerase [Saprospiraceae bacterium]
MALIQKIREKSALVLTLMVLAIVAFIGMLITQDSNRSWGQLGNTSTVAEVAGKELDIRDLDRKSEALYGNRGSDLNVRNTIFNNFIEEAIVNKEAEKAGLGVCKDELLDLEFGQNISPVMAQYVGDPQTGQVDGQQLMQIKQAIQNNTMPLQGKASWAEIEKIVVKERLQAKLVNLMSKGIYTPTWLVDESYKELTEPVDFQYVKVPFDRVDDKEVTVTDGDIQGYLDEYKSRFLSDEETRNVDFVTIDVTPTAADSSVLRDKIMALREGFLKAENDSVFAVANNGFYPGQYQDKESLTGAAKDSAFTAPIGSIFGPYVDNKAYWLAKVIDRRSGPDSVKNRHFLFSLEKYGSFAAAQKTADSIKTILEGNIARWDSLNLKYNDDPGSNQKGGDYGYTPNGRMVPEYNDLIFYKAVQGKLYTVQTRFGIHIIQVTGVKQGKGDTRTKLAYIRQIIAPSQSTDRAAAAAADELLVSSKNLEDLKANAAKKGLQVQTSPNFRASDLQLGIFGQATGVRQLIRWAYESKVGERSKQTFAMQQQGEPYVSQYVVAALKNIIPKGLPTVAAVKEQLTPIVKNRKKGEALKTKIGSVSDLNALVSQYNTKVDTAVGVTFNATFVPNMGSEAKVIGTAFTVPVGSVSPTVVGETGVYVLKVTKKDPITNSPVDKTVLRQQLGGNQKNMVRSTLLRSLKKKEDIEDNRAKFF